MMKESSYAQVNENIHGKGALAWEESDASSLHHNSQVVRSLQSIQCLVLVSEITDADEESAWGADIKGEVSRCFPGLIAYGSSVAHMSFQTSYILVWK